MCFLNKSILTLLAVCCAWIGPLQAQLSDGGVPKSFGSSQVDEVQVVALVYDAPDVETLLLEDESRDLTGKNLRDAVAIPVGLGLTNSGIWFDLDDGARIWRLKIKVLEAFSLEAYYDQFFLPSGGEFYVFNHNGNEVYGAYTDRVNTLDGLLSTEMVQGEIINFEYYEPAGHIGEGVINILDVGYRYRDVMGLDLETVNGGAGDCEVDVLCAEGNAWSEEARSTVRIRSRINGQMYWSSGTVMNNTAQDCRPLILSSLRCAIEGSDMSSEMDFDHYRFYFNYTAPSCNGEGMFLGHTMAGCTRLADSNDDGGAQGSDFLLLELLTDIPQEYDTYYAGWDASTTAPVGGGVSIHHPRGDVKKISTYSETPISASWGIPNTHWKVFWDGTISGHGVRELGSSGAGLLNSAGQLIGTLTGGTSFCDGAETGGQTRPDFYGKLSYHWLSNPNPSDEKLGGYLDPSGSNTVIFNGASEPCVSGVSELRDQEFLIYPNPVSDALYLQIDENQGLNSLSIIDVTGKVVQSESLFNAGEIMIDVSGLEIGVYFLRSTDMNGFSASQRFMVAR